MMNKVFQTVDEAIADIEDGASIMMGGFGPGFPYNLVEALVRKGTKNLTVITNTVGMWPGNAAMPLVERRQVKKAISSYPGSLYMTGTALEEQYWAGEVEVETMPQGTFIERIRAGGAGIGGFYTPVGVGTILEEGKEKRVINGREYLLELALTADYAFIRAHKADRMGNVIFRGSSRNFNIDMATAARITIAEVDDVVDIGDLPPEKIDIPSIFVKRVVAVPRLDLVKGRIAT